MWTSSAGKSGPLLTPFWSLIRSPVIIKSLLLQSCWSINLWPSRIPLPKRISRKIVSMCPGLNGVDIDNSDPDHLDNSNQRNHFDRHNHMSTRPPVLHSCLVMFLLFFFNWCCSVCFQTTGCGGNWEEKILKWLRISFGSDWIEDQHWFRSDWIEDQDWFGSKIGSD